MKSAGMQESIDRMIAEDEVLEKFKSKPFAHQKIGTDALVANPAFALFDEMGAGKSKQVVDAACLLAEHRTIDTVVVVCPASVRCVWIDKEIGEIKKHSWVCSDVYEFHEKLKNVWSWTNIAEHLKTQARLSWIVTNYEFLRSAHRLEELSEILKDKKILLVLDESSYIKNRTAAQAKAVLKLRKLCDRCVILNGTPITQSPLDLWSQMLALSPSILQKTFHNFYHFRSEYCEMRSMKFGGRRSFQQVVSYRRLDDLAKRLQPYVLRRLKADCLDLPEKLYTQREVALSPKTWKMYCELRKDCLLTLDSGDKQLEPNAAVRIMRLAQLTSGYLGRSSSEDRIYTANLLQKDENCYTCGDWDNEAQDISDEKLKWCVQYLTEECTAKAVIVWCRWRRERERLVEALGKEAIVNKIPRLAIDELYGGQNKTLRDKAVQTFSSAIPNYAQLKYILVAQPHAGGHGLNLIAATECVYLSNDFSLGIRLQSEDRCHRPGQKHPVTYIDVLATGPQGQKTIDATIFSALRNKQDVATLTTAQWRKELSND